MLQEAIAHHRAGRLSQAAAMYRQILAREPEHADALHLLGLVAHQSGNHEQALALIGDALRLRPEAAAYHNDLGEALGALGRMAEAIAAYREACRLDPARVETQNNLGLALQAMGRRDEALAAFRRATEQQPSFSEAAHNLAHALHEAGRLAEANAAYRRLLAIAPEDADAWNNLGIVLKESGDLAACVEAFQRAAALRPDFAPAWRQLGHALEEQGQAPAAAVAAFERAHALDPEDTSTACVLGRLLQTQSRVEEALRIFRGALHRSPETTVARDGLISALQALQPKSYDVEIEEDLRRLLDAGVYPPWLARPIAAQLGLKYRLRELAEQGGILPAAAEAGLRHDELLLTLLTTTVNTDRVLERALTILRRELLCACGDSARIPSEWRALTGALAVQCFASEYVLCLEPEEQARIAQLRARAEQLGQVSTAPSPALEDAVALFALYEAPASLDCAQRLGAFALDAWSPELRPLIERGLREPLQEQVIEPDIGSLAPIADGTSRTVRAHYEEHPYPRWFSLPRAGARRLGTSLRQRFLHFTPPGFLDGPIHILVAGSGTGFEPLLLARTHPDARILAIDLSRRSLAYALRMARTLDLGNVHFVQADLLALQASEERFEMIECVGVLHHMAEPLHGWRLLTDRLLPGGVMRIGVYSARARSTVVAARERIRELRLAPTADGIRAFRTAVMSGTVDGELARLAESEDFYTVSTCRDLLFHVVEHHFTPVQVRDALAELELEFIGLELPTVEIGEQYRRRFPEDPCMVDLSKWERFEALYPHTFAGMYVFWCQKR